MPEGPEIRLAADKVEAALKNRRLTRVYFAFDHLKDYQESLEGARVLSIETRGKALLTHTDRDLSIYSHNQLYGRWMVRKADSLPRTNRQLRLALHNRDHSAYLYSASDIAVLDTADLLQHPFLARLGPDIMSSSPGEVKSRVSDTRFSRRRLGQLLLDQGFLAGMGNYLRSETLYVAEIHPSRRPIDCSREELDALATAVLKLARQSYRHRGITNDLAQARRMKAEGVPRGEYRHRVFSREGSACYRCGGRIEKTAVAGRRLYYCPGCQPLKKKA